MLFEINENSNSIEPYSSSWTPKELILEQYLISTTESDVPTLNSAVFGEPLLLISNQVRTRYRKRADILALDRMGNAVIVELKRDEGTLGVEMQGLQYLVDFSRYRGELFVKHFSKEPEILYENIRGFLGDDIDIAEINQSSRLILIARAFDSTLFSMGEWLSSRGVAFRCIEYTPIEIGKQRYLSFSVVFDRAPESIYPLLFESRARSPAYFWHNIGRASDEWWRYLVEKGQISTSFECKPGDQGEKILKSYVSGDTIIAYATGYGALGFGIIENPNSYKLLKPNSPDDFLGGKHLHRLSIFWKYCSPSLKDGIRADLLRNEYGIYHPVSTSARIDDIKAKHLIEDMQNKSMHPTWFSLPRNPRG